MRFKLVQSEADGLFQKANRKHQILLNFELKRIAVEKKMRERYFSFEKSLVLAHREKIVARQKDLGLYRPQTTPEKRTDEQFFTRKVAMDTRDRSTLPPLQRKTSHRLPSKVKFFTQNSGSNKNSVNIAGEGLPNLAAPSWSLTEVQELKEPVPSMIRLSFQQATSTNEDFGGASKTNQSESIESSTDKTGGQMRDSQRQINSIKNNKTGRQNESEFQGKDGEIAGDTDKNARAQLPNSSATNHSEDTIIQNKSSSKLIHESGNLSQPDSISQQLSKESGERSLSTDNGGADIQRRKSYHSSTIEGARKEFTNLTLRAQSAGDSRRRTHLSS